MLSQYHDIVYMHVRLLNVYFIFLSTVHIFAEFPVSRVVTKNDIANLQAC